jgi:hypothetical protein
MKKKAEIGDWKIEEFIRNSRVYRLSGMVFGHPNFEDGALIYTTPIEKVDFGKKTVETHNTVYTLLG